MYEYIVKDRDCANNRPHIDIPSILCVWIKATSDERTALEAHARVDGFIL